MNAAVTDAVLEHASSRGDYRTCATTGLKVYRDAELLIKANAVAGVVFLLIGGRRSRPSA